MKVVKRKFYYESKTNSHTFRSLFCSSGV